MKGAIIFYTVMLWKGSQVPQEEDEEEAVTKKAIKVLEIFVSQIFYNFFSIILLYHFFLYFFLPTTFTHTHAHTHDPRLLAKLKAKFSVVLQPRASFAFLSNVWAKYRLMSSQKKSEQFDRKCMSSTTPV